MSDEERTLDEVIKHISGGKVYLEDINKRAEDKSKFMMDLVRHTLTKIVESVDNDVSWGIANGGEIPDSFRLQSKIAQEMLGYINILTKYYIVASNNAHFETFKDMLKEGPPNE